MVGPVTGPVTSAPLATATWTSPPPILGRGATTTASFSDMPSTPCAVLATFELSPLITPLAAEPLPALGSPTLLLIRSGMTDANGDFTTSLSIPAVTALQFLPVWQTGVFGGSLPIRSTAPLGGIIP